MTMTARVTVTKVATIHGHNENQKDGSRAGPCTVIGQRTGVGSAHQCQSHHTDI